MHACMHACLCQDLPAQWPWGQMEKEKEKPEPSGKGKGRGRGKGRGKTGPKGKGAEVAPKAKAKAVAKVPLLLTNLVRTGNQMKSSSSWRIVRNNLAQVIAGKLEIRAMSGQGVGSQANLSMNRSLLIMLGKLPAEMETSTWSTHPSPTMCQAAEELLQILGFVGYGLIKLFI